MRRNEKERKNKRGIYKGGRTNEKKLTRMNDGKQPRNIRTKKSEC